MNNTRCGTSATGKWYLLVIGLFWVGIATFEIALLQHKLASVALEAIGGVAFIALFLWQRLMPYLEISGDAILISQKKSLGRRRIKIHEIDKVVEEPGFDIVLNLVDKRSIVVKTDHLKADELADFLATLKRLIGQR